MSTKQKNFIYESSSSEEEDEAERIMIPDGEEGTIDLQINPPQVQSISNNNIINENKSPRYNKRNLKISVLFALSCLLLVAWTGYTLYEIFMKTITKKNSIDDDSAKGAGIGWYSHPECGKIMCTGALSLCLLYFINGKTLNSLDET